MVVGFAPGTEVEQGRRWALALNRNGNYPPDTPNSGWPTRPAFELSIVPGMIRVGSIVLRVDDLQRQTEFWAAALHYVRRTVHVPPRTQEGSEEVDDLPAR